METKDKISEQIKDGKTFIDELKLQLHLGKSEAKDEFEKQKENLVHWVTKTSVKLSELKDVRSKELTELRTKLDELQVQATLGKAETEDTIREQQKMISSKLNEINTKMKGVYDHSSDEVEQMYAEVFKEVTKYRAKFDVFRLQFHLGKEELKDKWNTKKDEFVTELENLKEKMENEKEEAKDTWDHFSTELNKSWEHLTSAFSKN